MELTVIEATSLASTEPKKKKYLPNAILRAVDAIAERAGLSAGRRTTLLTIAKYVKQHDPLGAVYTRREKIAQRSGQSVRTVNRHVSDLAARGLIRVEERRGTRTGRFGVTHLFLSEKLAHEIGLLPDKSATSEPPSISRPEVNNVLPPEDKLAFGHTLTNPSLTAYTKKDQRATGPTPTIPDDLTALLARNMLAPSICKLMSMSKAHGHRLSDVWTTVRSNVEKLDLTGMRLKRYLETTIAIGKNFAQRAAKLLEEARIEARREAEIAELAVFRAEYAGRVFETADGRQFIQVDAQGCRAFTRAGGVEGTVPLEAIAEVRALRDRLMHGGFDERRPQPLGLIHTVPTKAEPQSEAKGEAGQGSVLALARAEFRAALETAKRGQRGWVLKTVAGL